MKYVLACEGKSEVELIQKLLDNNQLVFDIDDILDNRPLHLRQPKTITPLIATLPSKENIVFYRIGDTQKDTFDTSCLRMRIEYISVIKVCTTPEIEILVIINENLLNEYNKVKSYTMPKEFVKQYVHGYKDFANYIESHDMIFAIKEYKRIKKTEKNVLCLADLLKNQ